LQNELEQNKIFHNQKLGSAESNLKDCENESISSEPKNQESTNRIAFCRMKKIAEP
jgi:hypothetical protein